MSALPVLIMGAGVSGLVLAQHLKKEGVPFEIFDRDTSLTTRGLGWGLTLHWCLEPLSSLLPDELVQKLPSTYADRISVEQGVLSRAPYYDLSNGKILGISPGDKLKVRVTRQRVRVLLSYGLDIQWGMSFKVFKDNGESVTVTFDDGTTRSGCLLVGCDGASSRIRQQLHPDLRLHRLPVHVTGMKLSYTPEECEGIRAIDPFIFSGIDPQNNSFLYCSVLDAPGSNEDSGSKYMIQASVSWTSRPGFLGRRDPFGAPDSQPERRAVIREIASTWSEPFKSLILQMPEDTEIEALVVQDLIPPVGFRQKGRVTLLGDSVHAMAMFRGEGANHAIYDVFEFSKLVTPNLNDETPGLRKSLDGFEDIVVQRTRPGVMASRRACLDAHDWTRVSRESPKSPLFLKREPWVTFDENDME